MGLQTKPAYIGTAGFTNPVENDRNLIEHTFGRSGVLRYGNFDLAAVAGVMQGQIQGGSAVILGSASTQGAYWGYSDAQENLAWPAANGSNPRWDTLIMRVIDTQYGASGAGDQLRWEILQGTPAASPVVLTDTQINTNFPQPGAWMRMWDVRVPAGVTNLTTATFTRRFPYTNTNGVLLYNSAVESRPAGLYRGETLMDVSTGLRYWWNGTLWVPFHQSVFSWERGFLQGAGNRLLLNQVGNQTAYQTPVIPVEPNMAYLITTSITISSGAAGTRRPLLFIDISGGGGTKVNSREMTNFPSGGAARVGVNDFIYRNGAGTTVQFDVRVTCVDGGAYDANADPADPAWFTMRALGIPNASLAG